MRDAFDTAHNPQNPDDLYTYTTNHAVTDAVTGDVTDTSGGKSGSKLLVYVCMSVCVSECAYSYLSTIPKPIAPPALTPPFIYLPHIRVASTSKWRERLAYDELVALSMRQIWTDRAKKQELERRQRVSLQCVYVYICVYE